LAVALRAAVGHPDVSLCSNVRRGGLIDRLWYRSDVCITKSSAIAYLNSMIAVLLLRFATVSPTPRRAPFAPPTPPTPPSGLQPPPAPSSPTCPLRKTASRSGRCAPSPP